MKRTPWLALILLLGACLRLINLGGNPPALYWDEASLGYNAFSIMTKGMDEHGVAWPVTHFLAYGDAKPPGYIYATAVAMAIFGVKEFAIRLPSALAGCMAIWLTYFLASELFNQKIWYKKRRVISLAAALFMAISPWHIHMSRAAFEANLALTLFLLGLWAFFKANQRPIWYLVSALSWVATWYTFNAYRLFLPPLLVILGIWHLRTLSAKHSRYWVLGAMVVALLITAPLIPFVLSDQAKLRFEEVTIFKNLDPIVDANTRIELNNDSLWAKVIHNRRVLFVFEFLHRYFDHFTFDFLFVSGDVNPRLGVRDMGVLYWIDGILMLIGSYGLAKKDRRLGWFLASWLTFAIVPAAVARETPHALRILQVLPLPQLVAAVGLCLLLDKKPQARWLVVPVYLISLAYFLNLYFVHYPRQWADSWQYGYKQLVKSVNTVLDQYDRVYITASLGRPHTYFLLYSQYDPEKYVAIREAGGDAFGFTETYAFDKYYFGDAPAEKPAGERWLYVSAGDAKVPKENVREVITNPQDKQVFIIHE